MNDDNWQEEMAAEERMQKMRTKGLMVFAAAIVCATMLWATDGQHGVGWFLLYLIMITG